MTKDDFNSYFIKCPLIESHWKPVMFSFDVEGHAALRDAEDHQVPPLDWQHCEALGWVGGWDGEKWFKSVEYKSNGCLNELKWEK